MLRLRYFVFSEDTGHKVRSPKEGAVYRGLRYGVRVCPRFGHCPGIVFCSSDPVLLGVTGVIVWPVGVISLLITSP